MKIKKLGTFERIEIIVGTSMGERDEAFNFLMKNFFYPTRTGGYTTKKLWPKIDPTRFMIIAERKII